MIFAGAAVLFLVAIVLDYTYWDISDSERIQAAKDALASQDALIDIFDRAENFFKRLETYTEVPTTEAINGREDNGGCAWSICDCDEGDEARTSE